MLKKRHNSLSKAVMVAALTLGMAAGVGLGCNGGPAGEGPKNGNDAAQGAGGGGGEEVLGEITMAAGTKACIDSSVGVRRTFEAALEQQEIEHVNDCLDADVVIKEEGDVGAFVLKYQVLGDSDWKECKSDSEDRLDFLNLCIETMRTEIKSGGSGDSGGGDEAGADDAPADG